MECGVWSVECGVWSVECGVWSVECGVWSVECGVWSVECGVWSVECIPACFSLFKELTMIVGNSNALRSSGTPNIFAPEYRSLIVLWKYLLLLNICKFE